MKRRDLLAALAALPALPAFGAARPGAAIPQRPALRVIVDNDFAGDPDGLFALAHHLLAPKSRIVLATSSPLDAQLARLAGLDAARTASIGADLARALQRRLGLHAAPPVVAGAASFGPEADAGNAAARAIVREALRDDPLPLVLACGGPLTNVAAALRLEPAIARRMTVAWIGGLAAPGGAPEYNLVTDLAAARAVLEQSDVPLWQVPAEEYRRFQVSVAELAAGMAPGSAAGRWLLDQYAHLPPFVQPGATLTFGDTPLVALTTFDHAALPSVERPVRRLLDDGSDGGEIAGRRVRLFQGLDPRLAIADFLALLRLHAARTR